MFQIYVSETTGKTKMINQPKNTDHDTQTFTWKTFQSEGKNHRHQPVTISLFLEYLQERHAAAAAYKMIIDQSDTLITVL